MARPLRRRFWKWVALVLTVGPMVVFLALQLVLATPWAARKVERRIGARIGLETRVGRVSWTPWSGLSLHDLEIAKPEGLGEAPLAKVAELRVWPDYSELVRRRVSVRGVDLREPELEVNVELLVSLAAAALREAPEPPAVVARVESAPPESPGPQPSPPAQGGSGGKPQMEIPTGPPPAVAEPAEKPAAMWLRVEDGSLRLVMREGAAVPELLEVEDLSGSIPIGGTETGCLSAKVAQCLGKSSETIVSLGFEGQDNGVVSIIPEISDKEWQVAGEVQIGDKSGIPFQASVFLQRELPLRLEPMSGMSGELERFQIRFQGQGWLRVPSTWRLASIFQSNVRSSVLWGQDAGFDAARGALLIDGGQVRCPEFRLSGEAVSLLGNGWLARGSGAAVLRVVVPETVAGSPMLEGIPAAKLEPGRRRFVDLGFQPGADGAWEVEVGEGGPVFPLAEWIERLRSTGRAGR